MTVKQRIKAILTVSHAARNSDKSLWLIYAQKSGMKLTEAQIEVFRDMPSMETLRRTRQVIQNTEGSLRPDQEVSDARFNKFKEMKSSIPFMDEPSKILETNGYRVLPYGQ